MKKLIAYTGLIAVVSLTGCKKYLDKEPDNRTQIASSDQLSQLLTSAYPKANYILFCESMSDNAEDKNGSGTGYDFIDRINRQSYRYEVVEATPDDNDSPDFYWNACYKAIASANLALQIIDGSSNKAQYSAQRGEALLARAYAHFMLVTLFSKAYDPATAASDPGIPYVTAPEKVVFAKYERKTVAYVYEMIEKDLKEGYPLINESIYGSAPKFHFNRQAAAAFAVRFYMFKRDYNSVVTYASQALTGATADNLRPWNTELVNMQYYSQQAEYTKATMRGNLLLQEANSVWGRSYASLRYGFGTTIFTNLFNTKNVSGWYYTYIIYGTPQVYNIPKFSEYFVKESLSAGSGQPYNTIPLLTAEEVVLNRAEAYTRLNNKAAAVSDLNAFISKNIEDYLPATDSVTTRKIALFYKTSDTLSALITTALDFKRAFFLHEGLRWLDILRLKIPVTHTTAAGEVITLTADDKRRSLQLPLLTKQAGLEPNAR
ncbi:MAG: RagB/SusD family nutrient uptake outer membrane protein [Williamsia sp.]|nr:RagB/SusD family nutrient uptake outer membrane protein [Williamsia sp.]